jgi:ubiquinone/menaquinone biosynthesis C-methylase UbiE
VDTKIEMDDFKLNPTVLRDGVYMLTEINNEFESIYLKVRDKEKRIYPDDELIKLPFSSVKNPHKKEWNLRAKSYLRFKEYLRQKKDNLNLLDLGCGNGWFCGQLSKSFHLDFCCVDVNLTELTQGRKIFNSGPINFIYADIFKADISKTFFDIIIINAAVQYFPDLKKLVERILVLLKNNGEIHIIDSPFYTSAKARNARQRTKYYYNSIGFPQMAENYFHHTWEGLSNFSNKIIYNPTSFMNSILNVFLVKDSPFPWICLTKEADTI